MNPLKLSHDDYMALMKGDSFLMLYFKLEYVDTFGVSHFVRRCMWRSPMLIDSGRTFHAKSCTDYTGVDDNPD